MSEYTEKLIQNLIDQYEADHGEIKITEEGVLHRIINIIIGIIVTTTLHPLEITLRISHIMRYSEIQHTKIIKINFYRHLFPQFPNSL